MKKNYLLSMYLIYSLSILARISWADGSSLTFASTQLNLVNSNQLTRLAQNDAISPSPESRRTVKLSPKLRSLERERSVPTIPAEIIQHFLNRPRLLTETDINDAGYLIEDLDQSMFSTVDDQIYVSGLDENAPIGNQYMIVRRGQAYRSPLADEATEILAHEAIYLGEATLDSPGDPATLTITAAQQEIKAGDLLLPSPEQKFVENFRPHSPEQLEDAYIIATTDGTSLIGRYQIVVINKGLDDHIERGHLLAVQKSRRKITTITPEEGSEETTLLPNQKIGSLLVFHVFDRVSYALVMTSALPINLFDEVTVP